MDQFKSAIIHGEPEYVCEMIAMMDDDDLHVDTVAYGWHDNGMDRIMNSRRLLGPTPVPMFFRGHAMFGNVDDAKNDYLMTPSIEQRSPDDKQTGHDEGDDFGYYHVPFGMVIPTWHFRTGNVEHPAKLVAATVILWWQEQ